MAEPDQCSKLAELGYMKEHQTSRDVVLLKLLLIS
jgi:hypothetical protein